MTNTFLAPGPRGVATFVAVSDDKIQITILVLGRGALFNENQGGITCGAINEPRKSSKAIDERVIINFRDKNVVIARFLLLIAFLFYR